MKAERFHKMLTYWSLRCLIKIICTSISNSTHISFCNFLLTESFCVRCFTWLTIVGFLLSRLKDFNILWFNSTLNNQQISKNLKRKQIFILYNLTLFIFFYKLNQFFVHNNVKLHKFLLWDGSMITYDERGYSSCSCILFGYWKPKKLLFLKKKITFCCFVC